MRIREDLHAFIWEDPAANNCNTYLLDGALKVLIDPGHAALFALVRDGLAALSLTPADMDVVLITHAHPDHMEACRLFTNADTLIAMSLVEMQFVQTMAQHYGSALGRMETTPRILLQAGDLRLGDWSFEVLVTPGHSPGSLCLYWPDAKVLFSGDLIFAQGIGRTDLPGGNGAALKDSIRRIAKLDVEHLLPGHGPVVSGKEQVVANLAAVEQDWLSRM